MTTEATTPLKVGQQMIWRKVVSNYGHESLIAVTVLRIGKRITIAVPQKDGGVRKTAVTPDRLHPVEAQI